MALNPVDEAHALQIQAGALARRSGHHFEDTLTAAVNALPYPIEVETGVRRNIFTGNPALHLLQYVASRMKLSEITAATALSTGALATSEEGKQWLEVNGSKVYRTKSDIVLTLVHDSTEITLGISVKQCNKARATNAQLYFTTANGFTSLLRTNGIDVSEQALVALRQFCGDAGYRPLDTPALQKDRIVDPRRYFWEELVSDGREEWERLLGKKQDEISRLLFQKAYLEDALVPEFLLHKTKLANRFSETEVAVFGIDELIQLSAKHGGFSTREYSVRKGSYKDPMGTRHQAPRFGVIQMQRGGQSQHPTQLQFNLEAGYFYKII